MEFKMGELFCGPGGLALGARLARAQDAQGTPFTIRHVWAVDNDPNACETFRRNIVPDNPGSVLCKDVSSLDIATLPKIDGLAFGFPCNDFSLVGERHGTNGKYGPLYKYGVVALQYLRPMWFVAENVRGLHSANGGSAFNQIIYEFEKSGYRVVSHLYRFEEYSVPQARHRILVVGIRADLEFKFAVPRPHYKVQTAAQALSDIPEGAPNQEPTVHAQRVIDRLSHMDPGENAFNAKNLPEELKLHVKGAHLSQIYRRLKPDQPAYTITGSGGGGTHVYHWDEPRALTNRERARLQTFPNDFEFFGSKDSVRKQIGMAVPPLGAQVIFEALLKAFARVPYESVKPSLRVTARPPERQTTLQEP